MLVFVGLLFHIGLNQRVNDFHATTSPAKKITPRATIGQ